ncbi:uncharacterized protein LOC126210109 isoform X3 [Schistocerca nitens]|uniref:uncharacterized protein LOC126210109 isoform X3 n=1 Tax=Schistocerca nitens TaxID=7011 RepID=UPI0021197692|nr:uncharacterized protein LOC126210109 isoform X3 [Schistocerca nitens]XP_049795207.1 uncharacterized protein LOC126210109 isoform X3 [Schistocerca nitens]XP_049795208.1 uncharacterized protein LOC126210109 isoform X3 [Schistocerca nitens]
MESTGELEAVTMCDEIDIKEEPVLTDPNWQLFEENEHIFIKEENVKLETPEDPDARDPLWLKKEESPPQEETISPPDAIHTKKEPELQKEVEAASCGIEPRRNLQERQRQFRHTMKLTSKRNQYQLNLNCNRLNRFSLKKRILSVC